MGRLLMLGVSHHVAAVGVRERLAIDEATWRQHAPAQPSTVFLSTCNRVEVYAWLESRSNKPVLALRRALARAAGFELSDLEPYLKVALGPEALVHLVRVTSGLDSLVVGEEQIRGQVRAALAAAEAAQPMPSALRGVFQRAGESARRIRGNTRLGKVPSVATAGVNVAARAVRGDLRGQLVAVLGAGVMARAAVDTLLSRGARVCVLNRTAAHAEGLLRHGPLDIEGLDALPRLLAHASLIVGATASREPVVVFDDVKRAIAGRTTPLVLLDIAVPRDIDPRVRELPVTLYDLDDLERLCPVDVGTRQAERDLAEAMAVEEAHRLAAWLRFRSLSPAIAELRSYAEGIRRRELQRAAAKLRDLTPDQLAAVEALTTGIVNKLMHGPTVALRDAPARSILRVVRPTPTRAAR